MTGASTRGSATGAIGGHRLWTVVAVFGCRTRAHAAVQELVVDGYSADRVSVVAREAFDPGGTGSPGADGPARGARLDRAVGGAFGPVALAIPGVGPVVAAGALGALLSGTLAGGRVGAFLGSFADLGAPREDADRYEAAVRSGRAVVALEARGDGAAIDTAERMRRLGAQETAVYRTTP